MDEVSSAEARAYLERWKLLREIEVAALRSTSMDTKLRQLTALMQARDAFPADPRRQDEVRSVRERWARIKQAMGG